MYNILVVEDEEFILKLMNIRLTKSGYNVFLAENGLAALNILYSNKIDLIIVDIMMPKMNGFELVERIRSSKNTTPIIMATAKESIADKTRCFNLGVDDYMVKPINHEELVLRINAILKRSSKIIKEKLTFGDVTIDYPNLKIYDSNGTCSVFTKKEIDIVLKLFSQSDQVITKNQILDECWGFSCDIYEESLKVHINKIRNKLLPFPTLTIETIRGMGYKGVVNDK